MTQVEAVSQMAKCLDLAGVVDLSEDEADALMTARIVVAELERRDIRLVSAEETVLSRGLTEALASSPAPMLSGGIRFLEDLGDGEEAK